MVSIEKLLEESRRELLDLGTRNRLLSMPTEGKNAKVVHVRQELSDAVFKVLVTDRKAMTFLPVPEPPSRGGKSSAASAESVDDEVLEEDEESLPQPDDELDAASGEMRRHTDSKLQTALRSEKLQTRLLGLFRDAQLIMEEQGVNILYLALGRLKWFEAPQSEIARYAPLLLVPVQLVRKSARERFQLVWREEEPQDNLTLVEKMKADFGLEIPRLSGDEDIVPSAYAAAVAGAIAGCARWEVETDAICLGFFSFAKFMLYRDLDPKNWPAPGMLLENGMVQSLLHSGFQSSEPSPNQNEDLDAVIPADRLDHVVDADSSQTQAIELVRQGRNLVIQGPPGTGKSQSIANILATAVLDGKTVLFVAEKMAALSVVRRRLDAAGLGDLCLELHSGKAQKRTVLEELRRTWNLGKVQSKAGENIVPRLEEARGRLNLHAQMIHTPFRPSGLTPYRILGALTRLDSRGLELGEVPLEGVEGWDAEAIRRRRALVAEMVSRVDAMGRPATHPWRGTEREQVLSIDLPMIGASVSALAAALADLQEKAARAAAIVRLPAPENLEAARRFGRIIEHVASAPKLGRRALRNGVWEMGLSKLREMVARGRKLEALRTKHAAMVTDAAFEQDLSAARAAIAAHGGSIFRILYGSYRRGMAALKGIAKGPLPATQADRVALLDDLAEARGHLLALRESNETGQHAFGDLWAGDRSNWAQLDSIVEWVAAEREAQLLSAFREKYGELDTQVDYAALHVDLVRAITGVVDTSAKLAAELKLNVVEAFGHPALEKVPFVELAARVQEWSQRLQDLTRWNTWYQASLQAREAGLGGIVDGLKRGAVESAAVANVFERALFSALLRALFRSHPELARFDGLAHDRLVQEFRQLDRDRLRVAKERILAKHHEGLPAKMSGLGATGILLSELEKKRGHRSIRRLLRDAGSVVQAIKPIFMMSPLSVAQHLEPGALQFDLLVIDEASQVEPIDAFGAFARAKQCVVVGDTKQLSPTRFFARLTSDEAPEGPAGEDIQVAKAKDIESILGLCCARGLPEAMLRWHYRSRHHSLIAVSNQEFYENKLFIVPSPSLGDETGLRFHYVEGVYDRGTTATNRVEARAVCLAVLDHVRKDPNLTLGVAAFSLAQSKVIQDELELLRREHTEFDNFCNQHPHEPFFVKNLESVQGDERDVIMISVGYGRDEGGILTMNFGPLSTEGGERRLNVLISRAKRRCEVFSSIRAEDIDLNRTSGSKGVRAFKIFLQFAETGRLQIAEATDRGHDSPFEESVKEALVAAGYEVHPQVGLAGFFIDLGVVDPEKPSRYLAGIECDGASYHSSRYARERDRLRQAVLEDHGWTILRIWSTDWFQHKEETLRRILGELDKAKLAMIDAAPPAPVRAPAPPATIVREEPSESDDKATSLSIPYVEANFAVPPLAPHDLTPDQLAEVVFKILSVEAPIHESEIAGRIRDLWGLGRAGSRIQALATQGVALLQRRQRCTVSDGFVSLPGAPIAVRNREATSSTTLRKAETLPPTEIQTAILAIVEACHGATPDQIVSGVLQAMGFKNCGPNLRQAVEAQLTVLEKASAITNKAGRYVTGKG